MYGFFFYLISAVVIGATAIAITRRNLVHAVVYLIVSYFGTAMLFYLFGAPLLAALEIIIYAGAIMVLFLFVIMMIEIDAPEEVMFSLGQWLPAAVFGLIYVVAAIAMIVETPGTEISLSMLVASPRQFALYVFEHHWFLIEVISILLMVALIGALHLGKAKNRDADGHR
ncbi:NADH:ubiquinone oxidoreductase, membrane subunit J [Syntrophobacter sp. SbD1]|nr:NADH:ubiquinone oxidoreductase, membrane subunit J [Syntrophobacter sp. SbD1]